MTSRRVTNIQLFWQLRCASATLAQLSALLIFAASFAKAEEIVDVFVGGEGGYPAYRIPAITRIESAQHSGRLLAFAEGRDTLSDNGLNDIVLRLSDDRGASWTPVHLLCDVPERSLNNPCVVEVTRGAHAGRVLLMFQSYPVGCGEGCVVVGYESSPSDRVCRTLLMHTDDAGATWSAPREITREVKRATGATSTAVGPGIGIQLAHGAHQGRVIMPFNEGPADHWRVYAAFSDDGGDSWRIGENAPNDAKGMGNEVQIFERADGSVVLNTRQHHGAKRRKTATSLDGGATWNALVDVPELPDPTCMGGVLAVGGSTVLFTGCDSESRRALGTVWISRDDGRTWGEKHRIEEGGFAYSVPVLVASTVGDRGATTIGVLYEAAGYARIRFARWVVPAAPAVKAPTSTR